MVPNTSFDYSKTPRVYFRTPEEVSLAVEGLEVIAANDSGQYQPALVSSARNLLNNENMNFKHGKSAAVVDINSSRVEAVASGLEALLELGNHSAQEELIDELIQRFS